jgi:hypothetical protein
VSYLTGIPFEEVIQGEEGLFLRPLFEGEFQCHSLNLLCGKVVFITEGLEGLRPLGGRDVQKGKGAKSEAVGVEQSGLDCI